MEKTKINKKEAGIGQYTRIWEWQSMNKCVHVLYFITLSQLLCICEHIHMVKLILWHQEFVSEQLPLATSPDRNSTNVCSLHSYLEWLSMHFVQWEIQN